METCGKIHTGFHDLDSSLGGFGSSDLSMIYTNQNRLLEPFILSLVENIAIKGSTPTLLVTSRNTVDDINEKLIAGDANVGIEKLVSGKLSPEEFKAVVASISRVRDSEFYFLFRIECHFHLFLEEVESVTHEKNIRIIFIDWKEFRLSRNLGDIS